jgi:membrane-associated phospholipid phosphatase
MQSLWFWGTQIVQRAQSLGPAWLLPAQVLSSLGAGQFFLFLVTLVYWCLDASLGLRLAFLLVCVDGPTGLLKLAFHTPRPYWYSPAVRAFSTENSYGMPSGHATATSAVGLFFAQRSRRWWAWPLAGILVLLVSFSRVYLGVHFPTDVAAGWIVGALVWLTYVVITNRAGSWIRRAGLATQLSLAVTGSGLLLILTGGLLGAIASHPDPPEWAITAFQNAPGNTLNPRSPGDLVASAGLLLGLGIGAALASRGARFQATGRIWKRFLRFVIGLSGIFIWEGAWAGLVALLPTWNGLALQYFRSAVIGFWAVFLAPFLFLRLGLAAQAT